MVWIFRGFNPISVYINQRLFSRQSCEFRDTIYRNNSVISIQGCILPNQPVVTLHVNWAVDLRDLMIRSEFIPGIWNVLVTMNLVLAPEPSMQLMSFTFQTLTLSDGMKFPQMPGGWLIFHH